MWQPWSNLVARCDATTLLHFFEQVGTVPMVDVGSLDWVRPLGGVVSVMHGSVHLHYDDEQLHAPGERYMCYCRRCDTCKSVKIHPWSYMGCQVCDTECMPQTPPRSLCICRCTIVLSLESAVQDVRCGDLRIPQLCCHLQTNPAAAALSPPPAAKAPPPPAAPAAAAPVAPAAAQDARLQAMHRAFGKTLMGKKPINKAKTNG